VRRKQKINEEHKEGVANGIRTNRNEGEKKVK
jgi:hypothetical protein